jgi:FkbM family methyltransferase
MNALKTAAIRVLNRVLPGRTKNSFFHLSFHLARAEFERFAHEYSFAPHMQFGLTEMAMRGFYPKTIIDVGAFEGAWSHMVKQIWPISRLCMIEPNLEKRTHLVKVAKDLDATLFFELLGAENNQAVRFNVMGSGSSIMKERSGVPRTVETRYLRTLDAMIKEIKPPGLLKIDAQGYELQILKGALETLLRVDAVLLEIAIIEINEGAPIFHDVIGFMRSHGFVAYDILEIHRRPLDKALNQIDVMFVREHSVLLSDKRHFR